MGSPSIPDPVPPPAQRPERATVDVAEKVQLGGSESLQKDPSQAGKRALMRPRGTTVQQSSAASGLKV